MSDPSPLGEREALSAGSSQLAGQLEAIDQTILDLQRRREAILRELGEPIQAVTTEPTKYAGGGWVDLGVAAKTLKRSKETLRRWISLRPEIGRKIGGRWKISLTAVGYHEELGR